MLAVAALFILREAVMAQWTPPEIKVRQLSARAYQHIEEDEAQTGTEADLDRLRAYAQTAEDLAVISVESRGIWYQPADYLAREKAAALGANFLVLTRSSGDESLGAGAVKVYRAVRLLDSAGKPVYVRREYDGQPPPQRPAVPGAEPPAPPQVSTAAAPAPAGHRHFAWLSEASGAVVSHETDFDPAKATGDEVKSFKAFLAEKFPEKQRLKALKALEKKVPVRLELKTWRVE